MPTKPTNVTEPLKIHPKRHPSKQWTARERIIAIEELSMLLLKHMRGGDSHYRVMLDAAERLQFMAGWSAKFLEANRHQILNGEMFPEHRQNPIDNLPVNG